MYLHKDNLDEAQKEHTLLLQSFEIEHLIFLKRGVNSSGEDRGTVFFINRSGQVLDITWNIAVILGIDMVRANWKSIISLSDMAARMRDLSELLYDDWSRIKVHILE